MKKGNYMVKCATSFRFQLCCWHLDELFSPQDTEHFTLCKRVHSEPAKITEIKPDRAGTLIKMRSD